MSGRATNSSHREARSTPGSPAPHVSDRPGGRDRSIRVRQGVRGVPRGPLRLPAGRHRVSPRRPRHRRRLRAPSSPGPGRPRTPACRTSSCHHVRHPRRADQVDSRPRLGSTQPSDDADPSRLARRPPLRPARCHPLGRDPGVPATTRPAAARQQLLDRRLLARPRATARDIQHQDYADFAEHDGLELVPCGRSPWNVSWNEPRHTGGQQSYRTQSQGAGRTPGGVGDHDLYRPPERGSLAGDRLINSSGRASRRTRPVTPSRSNAAAGC